MKKHMLIIVAFTCFALTACNTNGVDNPNPSNPAPGSSGSSAVETDPANTTYRPAFSGQTRVAGVRTLTNYQSTVLTQNLRSPWGITSLPDGRLLITEKAGTMRIVTPTGQLSEPITGIPVVNSAGQGGLLGVRIDPAFATNRMVYWVFSESRPDGNLTAVARGTLSPTKQELREQPSYTELWQPIRERRTMVVESYLIGMETCWSAPASDQI